MLAFTLTTLVSSAGGAALLTSPWGRRLGLQLMYALAAMPGVVVLQVCD